MRTNAWSLGNVSQVDYRVFSSNDDRRRFDRLVQWTSSQFPLLVSMQEDDVWAFSMDVQGPTQSIPSEFDTLEAQSGSWQPTEANSEQDEKIKRMLLLAIEKQVETWLLKHATMEYMGTHCSVGTAPAFRKENEFLEVNEPQFVFRTLSSNRKDMWETFTDKNVPSSAFKIQAQFVHTNQLWLHFQTFTKDVLAHTRGITHPHELWKRLEAMPCEGFGADSMIDVWTIQDVSLIGVTTIPPLFPSIVIKNEQPTIKRQRTIDSVDSSVKSPPPVSSPFAQEESKRKTPSTVSPLQSHATDDEAMTPISPELAQKKDCLCVDFGYENTPPRISRHVHIYRQVPPKVAKRKRKAGSEWRVMERVTQTIVPTPEDDCFDMPDDVDKLVPLPLPRRPESIPILHLLSDCVTKELEANRVPSVTPLEPTPLFTALEYQVEPKEDIDQLRYMPRGKRPYNAPLPGVEIKSELKTALIPELPQQPSLDQVVTQVEEIHLGTTIAIRESLVGWRHDRGAWKPQTPNGLVPSSYKQRDELLSKFIQPYLMQYGTKSKTTLEWQTPDMTIGLVTTTMKARIPDLCVSKTEVAVPIAPNLLPEWSLRGFQPMGPTKNLDYVVLCPQTQQDWLLGLVNRYMAAVRAAYIRLSLGDHEPLDIATRWNSSISTDTIRTDMENATLLIRKSEIANDALQTYREAATILRPFLSEGPTKQAFARSAIANVIYLVAPFARTDSHNLKRLLGAVALGLFGSNDVEWKDSVVFEILYLDELLDTTTPSSITERAFALYDKVLDKVSLTYESAGQKPLTRYVNEKLFHLADDEFDDVACQAFLGYKLTCGWLLASLVDATGSLTDVFACKVDTDVIQENDMEMLLEKLFAFAVLSRPAECKKKRCVVCVTKVLDTLQPEEQKAWQCVWKKMMAQDAKKYESHIKMCLITSLNVPKYLQWHNEAQNGLSTLVIAESEALLHLSPFDVLPGECRVGKETSVLALALERRGKSDFGLILSVDAVLKNKELEEEVEDGEVEGPVAKLATQLNDHTWLTMHPVLAVKQSPYPLHVAAVERMASFVADTTS
ncbi:hypothetical protein THRCLA_01018 [Thraustotheca clavata]|uniref:MID domain-containing protein n=1 Tax=Thraustotheca clavata TaxID=74557 RepID=A0A1W0A9I9_9STRA|nr:hypothetical protein THRCLA_01018 [Thraustotheca clavata]